jgi:hypothetical protein
MNTQRLANPTRRLDEVFPGAKPWHGGKLSKSGWGGLSVTDRTHVRSLGAIPGECDSAGAGVARLSIAEWRKRANTRKRS